MRYHVTGAHRESGHDMSCVVEATSTEDVELIAREQGMFVAEIVPAEEPSPPAEAPSLVPIQQRLASGELVYGALRDELSGIEAQMAELTHRLAEKKTLLAQLARLLGKAAAPDAAPISPSSPPPENSALHESLRIPHRSARSRPARGVQATS